MKNESAQSDDIVSGLLAYLEETKQGQLIPEMSEKLNLIAEEKKRAKEIKIVSSIALDDFQLSAIKEVINRILKLNLPIVNKVDRKILGGFTITVGDWYFDDSVRLILTNLKKRLLT